MSTFLYDGVPPSPGSVLIASLQQRTTRRSPSGASPTTRFGARRPAPPRVCTAGSSDAALFGRARAGDAAAFAAIYDRHAGAALAVARRIVRGDATAEDVVQESFLALWRTDSYRVEKGTLRTFLLRIVHNRSIDALRKNHRWGTYQRIDEEDATRMPAGDHTDGAVERIEDEQFLRAVLSALPEAQQCALELAYFAGLTHAEIAETLDEPVGTVKSRIRLGLEKLRLTSDRTDYR